MKAIEKYKVMLGSDPELLLTKTVHGVTKPFPIIGLLGHGKDNPLHIDGTGFRTLQEDNVTLEYTTHPTSKKEDWIKEQQVMYKTATDLAEGYGLKVNTGNTAAQYDEVMLRSVQAETFGCEPTWNCYKNAENPRPNANTRFRSAGGHVHISYDGHTPEKSMEIVKLLDALYATAGSANLKCPGDRRRRMIYGTAGEARLKSYGVEWRVPGNAWTHTPEGARKIWEMVEEAFDHFDKGIRVASNKEKTIISAINEGRTLAGTIDLYLSIPVAPVVAKPAAKRVTKVTKTVKPKAVAKKAPVVKTSRKLVIKDIPF